MTYTNKSAAATMGFGDLLRNHRKSRELQLGQLARLLSIPPSLLSDIELGRRQPFRTELLELCAQVLSLTESQTEELVAAAAASRGAFELTVDVRNVAASTAGAALMREWPGLPDKAYEELTDVIRRYKKEKGA